MRRCPIYFQFDDVLTVRYLFHERTVRRGDVEAIGYKPRSTTIGGGTTIPLTANDALVDETPR